MTSSATLTLIFVDSSVKDHQHLIKDVDSKAEIVVLQANQDGIEQITQTIAQYREVESVHIVSHGQPGKLYLGSAQLSLETLNQYVNHLRNWAKALTTRADILLYGCEVAAGAGKQFVQQLSSITGAAVAASTNLTGHASLGGDWEFEVKIGSVKSAVAFSEVARASYAHTLAPDALPNVIYTISGSREVFFVNTKTGSTSLPTSLTTGLSINNQLAFDTIAIARDAKSPDNLLYYISATGSKLGTWNPNTGATTEVNMTGATLSNPARMAFRENGQLYAIRGDQLYTVSTGTGLGTGNTAPAGTTTLIGTISGLPTGNGGDMAFDPANPNVLYISASDNSLYRVTFTGSTPSAATLIGTAGSLGSSSPGLAFGPDGNLYGSFTTGPATATRLIRINTSNGTTVQVGTIGRQVNDFATLPIAATDVDLSVTITDSKVFTTAGSSITYIITVTNNSGYNVRDISIIDNFTDPNFSGTASWSASSSTGVSFPPGSSASGTGNIDTRVNLAAGASVTYTVTGLSVKPTATGSISNTVTVSPPEGLTDRSTNPGANSATDTTTIGVDTTAPVVTVNSLTTADGTPSLTGTVDDPDATIKVTVNGKTYDAVNNGNGTWTLPDNIISPALTSGTYNVTVTATDPLGNVGTDATTNELVVDSTAPVVTVNSLTTADGTPQLTGTVDDKDATVKVTVNGKTYDAVNNGNGTWTLPDNIISPALTSGTYNVTVTATDPLGNVGTDATTNELVVDSTAPVVTVNSLTTADGTPQLTGTVDDKDATVKVTVNGKTYDAVNNGNGTWTLPDNIISPVLASGTYNVTATATDTLGNVGTDSTTGELIVDRTAPVVTVNSLTTADGTPSLTGTVDDPDATIKVTVNGKTYDAVNNGNGTWTLPDNIISPALTSGTYNVTVTATDTLGNVGTDSTTGELIVDSTAPVVTVNSLTTADGTPSLTGTVDDPDATVKVTVNGKSYDAVNNKDGTWTLADNIIDPALADGTYNVTAVATDSLGNQGTDATTAELTIDQTAPVVTIDFLETSDSTPQLTGTVDDPTAEVTVTVNGKTYKATNKGDGTWILTDNTINPLLPDDKYDVIVTATDSLGNIGKDTTANELTIDQDIPAVTVNFLTTKDSTPQLTGTVSDSEAVVQVTVNGNVYTAINNGDGTWTLPDNQISPALADGTYNVRATATKLGKTGIDITNGELVIDQTAPTVTVNSLITRDRTPQLTGTVDDPTAIVKVTISGKVYTATNNGNGTWTLADNQISPALADGTYDVKATATDVLGNVGEDKTSNELIIDAKAPIVTVKPARTADRTPPLTGTVDDPTATIRVTINGKTYEAVNKGDGTWELPNDRIDPALPDGTYNVVVTATDSNGNVGRDNTTGELTIDNTLPAVLLTPIDLTTSEAGGKGQFQVRLSTRPTATVVLNFTSSDTTEGRPTATITFTPNSWNQPQTVVVTGVDDALVDGDISYKIQTSVSSTDRRYNGIRVDSLNFVNIDNDREDISENAVPIAENTAITVSSNTVSNLSGISAVDLDGEISSYTITSLPAPDQGIIYLGDPVTGGIPISAGQTFTSEQIKQLFFQPSSSFTGGSFSFSATDNNGASSAVATVSLIASLIADLPPVAVDVTVTIEPGDITNIAGLLANAPGSSIALYIISTLPSPEQGILFLGDPANGGIAVTLGQRLTPEQVQQLTFQSTATFSSGSFTYTAIDANGNIDQTPATVTLNSLRLPTCQPGMFLKGTRRRDGMQGTIGSDRLRGMRGNDRIRGEECNDVLLGGRGRDRLFGNDGDDILRGGTDSDRLRASFGNDVLNGGRGNDRMFGGPGTDLLRGGQRRDRLNGNQGDDRMFGGLGRDRIRGGAGDDFAKGNRGNDLMRGGAGNDVLRGNRGRDRILGGSGNDTLHGGLNSDRLNGNQGNDRLFGRRGNDRLRGRKGDDLLYGGLNRDRLWGGANDDMLVGGRGSDTLSGGSGSDTFVYSALTDQGDRILDFDPTEDVIDLSRLFANSSSNNPFTELIQLVRMGANTVVKVKAGNGATDRDVTATSLVTLLNIDRSTLSSQNFLV